MADRVDATNMIGGALPEGEEDALIHAILADDLQPEWDETFRGTEEVRAFLRDRSGAAKLYGPQARSGEFEGVQALCVRLGLTYVLTYDGCGGEWGPARRIRTPDDRGEGVTCPLSEDGGWACVTAQMIFEQAFFDVAEILAFLRRFDEPDIPPLTVIQG